MDGECVSGRSQAGGNGLDKGLLSYYLGTQGFQEFELSQLSATDFASCRLLLLAWGPPSPRRQARKRKCKRQGPETAWLS